MNIGDIDWGDAPTWVAGAFAAAAAYYTRGMLRSQREQIAEQRDFIAEQSANLSLERQALLAQAEERLYAQARCIEVRRERNSLRVFNHSDAPIHGVSVAFGEDGRRAVRAYRVTSSETGTRELLTGDYPTPVEVIGVGSHFSFLDPFEGWDDVAVLYFTDADGAQWQLTQHGRLELDQSDEGTDERPS
ncbi:hypothetical protein ACFY7C_11995 [Streptomyces sp. NPDC012769]|uniref:hypothetical protein n=1 Tax=Streptomyces sp. NPDC012769 TaxID=3364848 RepID=UPI0036866084